MTLIDFTLSRARLSDDRVACDPFSDDCIFDGEGKLVSLVMTLQELIVYNKQATPSLMCIVQCEIT